MLGAGLKPCAFCYNQVMVSRIAVLGGTFDPLHVGHLAIAEDVRVALAVEHVLFVPAAQQPLKPGIHMATALDRLAMARLGTADNPFFGVSDIEVRRGGVSYTVDTIAQLALEYAQAELHFVLGADAALELPRWHNIGRLLQLCQMVIVDRPGYQLDLRVLRKRLPLTDARIIQIKGPNFDISATELRQRLLNGQPVRYHLHPRVHDYIEQNGLYRDAQRRDTSPTAAVVE